MAAQVIFRNSTGTAVYAALFFDCPVPNRFSSLAMVASKVYPQNLLEIQMPHNSYAFTWAKYNQKHKGIFTNDNQQEGYVRSSNVITFSNDNGPGFKNQEGAPADEFDIKIDKNVRSNSYYGGLCLGNKAIFAQLMQPGDTQRYPIKMNLMFAYSYQQIETGQIITPTAIKITSLQEYQGAYQIFVELDQSGQVHVSTQVAAAAEQIQG